MRFVLNTRYSNKKTIDSILEGFNENIADLEAIGLAAAEQIESKAAEVQKLESEIKNAKQEQTRAATIAANIRKLIGA